MPPQIPAELLRDLIAVPSVNPSHCPDPEISGEKRMADLIGRWLSEREFRVERLFPMGEARPAVVGKYGPVDPKTTLMIEMHLDTVGVADMTVPPFQAEIRDGRVYGRGSCDMKGSMAAFFYALTPERMQRLSGKGVELMVVAAPDEETGLGGSTLLAEQGLSADAAVILEPTCCLPVIAHKGALWYEVELRGRSGHGSQPEKGVSTNAALARFLPDLFAIHQELNERFDHPVLGKSSLNLGRIEGGQTYNIIPERTLLLLDRRVIPNEPAELFPEEVNGLIGKLVEAALLLGGECRLTNRTDSFATDGDSGLVKRLQASITRITGESAPVSGTSWVSDASPFSQVCGETLVFGPGDIAQAHTDNEFITLEQLNRGAEIFADFLDHFNVS